MELLGTTSDKKGLLRYVTQHFMKNYRRLELPSLFYSFHVRSAFITFLVLSIMDNAKEVTYWREVICMSESLLSRLVFVATMVFILPIVFSTVHEFGFLIPLFPRFPSVKPKGGSIL